MYDATIEMTDEDFEFARPPVSRDFILQTFEKYDLKYIAYFGGEMFYVARQDMEPFQPLNPRSPYPEDIEAIFDFMVIERIRMIKYEDGILLRGAISSSDLSV
jgi:hypothetical protein